MKPLLCAAVIAACLATIARAEPVVEVTHPIPGDPFTDTRIEGCTGTFGVGLMRYFGTSAHIGDDSALTDFCLDDASGTLAAAEPKSGLTLVADDNGTRKFELLDGEASDYMRVSLRLALEENFVGVCSGKITGSETVHYHLPKQKHVAREGAFNQALLQGFTLVRTAPAPRLASSTEGHYLAIAPLSQDGGKPLHIDSKLAGGVAAMYGTLSFGDNSGTLSITKGDGGTTGAVGGALTIAGDDTGQVTMTGRFEAKSARLAGHHPKEWVSMSGTVDYMRGWILGEEGEAMQAMGLARGSYTNASGETHPIRAEISLYSCGTD